MGNERTSVPSALVLTCFDIARDPRPRRSIRWLSADHEVTVIAPGTLSGLPAQQIVLPVRLRQGWAERLAYLVNLLLQRDEAALDNAALRGLASQLRDMRFDIIVCHDLVLLPLVFAVQGRAQVVFDAREYYPEHYSDRLAWRLMFGGLMERLCERYLRRCDLVLTVSNGIAARYAERFGADCRVIESVPDPFDLIPGPVDRDHVRMVHHGSAAPNRHLEGIIWMMDHLDERFTLDMYILGDTTPYGERLRREAASRTRVQVLPAIPFTRIVPTLNAYDIGVFLTPPVNFNLEQTMPNKFFEFIQARLAVAIGPSPAMKQRAEELGVGIVAPDFSPEAMAKKLSSLSTEEIWALKQQAHLNAELLNSVTEGRRFRVLLGLPADSGVGNES